MFTNTAGLVKKRHLSDPIYPHLTTAVVPAYTLIFAPMFLSIQ